jgi:hypothetical protein
MRQPQPRSETRLFSRTKKASSYNSRYKTDAQRLCEEVECQIRVPVLRAKTFQSAAARREGMEGIPILDADKEKENLQRHSPVDAPISVPRILG